MDIRDAIGADMAAVLEIYNDAVLTTTAVWSETPRTPDEQRDWFAAKCAQQHPVLIAVMDGAVAGFCSYGPFRAWRGYRYTVENSIYVARAQRGRGVAGRLLAALIERAQAQGLHRMIAGIEAQNDVSIRLHERAGFTHAGMLHEVGYKFGRWLDLALMERRLERSDEKRME
jgi:L-amino acid N-acyltransferase